MTAVVPLRHPGAVAVSDESLDALLTWVTDPSTRVEDIAWNSQEFQAVRDWLKAHESAQHLRRKAVRVELIALRRVATEGLASKLSGSSQVKPTARWLGTLTDEGFADLLEQLTGEETPISLWRRAKKEQEKVNSWLEWEDHLTGRPTDPLLEQEYRFQGAAHAARQLLADLQIEGTSFTVQEAADRLAIALEEDGVHVHQALRGTPLTQLVRNAIHRDAEGYETFANQENQPVRVPAFVTYETNNGVVRVPWHVASLEQLKAFVEIHESKARALADRAQEYRNLLDVLERLELDPGDGCETALAIAKRRALLNQTRSQKAYSGILRGTDGGDAA